MKKLYYLPALIALAFASCKPLSKTYSDLDAVVPALPLNIYTSTAYASIDAAKAGIPTLLNTKYGDYIEGTSSIVSFPITAGSPFVADNLLTHVAYTMLPADYTFTGNSNAYLTSTTAITYLNLKYPTPVANQLVVLTYLYFEANGGTATAGNLVTDSFLYLNGAWTKLYTVLPAQYTSVARGANNYFVSTDVSNLVSYFNTFLLTDPVVMATAKVGDVKYVSYKYTATLQQVQPLTFDGTNWVNKYSYNFLKFNGTWVPDPTVKVTFADSPSSWSLVTVTGSTLGSDGARTNLAKNGDFDIRTTSTAPWTDAQITAAIILELPTKVASPIIGLPYKVGYYVYTGTTSIAFKNFKWDGTTWIPQ